MSPSEAPSRSYPKARGFAARLAIWTTLCSAASIPSFIWARREYDAAGMAAGVSAFILLYTAATGSPAFLLFRRRPFIERTLRIGFGTRVCITILFPVGMAMDFIPGLVATGITNRLLSEPKGTGGTFLTTLLQGALLNVVLLIYMALVYSYLRQFGEPDPPVVGICRICDYDLRGTPERCPECGTWVVEPQPHAGNVNPNP